MKTVLPRTHWSDEKLEVFRCPQQISDNVYGAFNSLIHRSRVTEGVPVWASRMIREEAFTADELRELKAIITSSAPETEISAEILGGRETLKWIEAVLKGDIKSHV